MTNEQFAAHRKSLQDFLNHQTLHFPQFINHHSRESHHDSEVTDEAGRRIKVFYNLEHSDKHVFRAIDDEEHVLSVTESTNGTYLQLEFSSPEEAHKFRRNLTDVFETSLDQKIILTGSIKWGMRRSNLGYHKQLHPILTELDSKDEAFLHVINCTVRLLVKHIPIERAIKNGEVHIEIDVHPDDVDLYRPDKQKRAEKRAKSRRAEEEEEEEKTQLQQDLDTDPLFHRRRLGLFSSLTNSWNKIKSVATTVASATVAIVQTAASLATGSLDETVDETVTLANYNYDTSTQSAVESIDLETELGISTGVSIECTQCYAYAAVTLVISVGISNYNLNTAEAYVTGDMNFRMAMTGTIDDITYDYETEVFSWTSPTYYFTIGPVPFTVTIETPVNLELSAALTFDASVTADLYATANFKAGFLYQSGTIQQVSSNSFSYGGTGLQVNDLCGATATVAVSLLPMAQMVISFIGGPNIALTGTVEAIASTTDSTLAINFNYLGTIGGQLNVEISGIGTIYGPTDFGPFASIKGATNLYTTNIWSPPQSICGGGGSPSPAPIINPTPTAPNPTPTAPAPAPADDNYYYYPYYGAPACNVVDPSYIGDGWCDDGDYNTEA